MSAWGNAWSRAWGNAWGALGAIFGTRREVVRLRSCITASVTLPSRVQD